MTDVIRHRPKSRTRVALPPLKAPAIVLHDRLEGTPRATDFSRALRAEVRDAVWMLSSQLRSGEFRAEDAGSPAFATVNMARAHIRKFRAGPATAQRFDDDTPLEAIVERRPIPFKHGTVDISLDLRLLMGRQWLKLAASLGDFAGEFVRNYAVAMPPTADNADAPVMAHWEARCMLEAVAGRRMDGKILYDRLKAVPPEHVYQRIPALAPQRAAVEGLEKKFTDWFERVFHQPPPDQPEAWQPSRMEYQFSCGAPWVDEERVFAAEEYYHGRIDWYNLDVDAGGLGATPAASDPPLPNGELQTVIPAPLSFDGMPNPRWWSFEDRRTNFGEINPNTTDIAKLLFMEFGLEYSNDWSIIPYTMPHGSLAKVRGMAVTNVFGERLWIEPAGLKATDAWQKWAMFAFDARRGSGRTAEAAVVLLPTPTKVQEGRPLEKVLMVRDEMSNMVWGIEEIISLPTSETKPGIEAAREMVAYFREKLPTQSTDPPQSENIRYQVINNVPENWIPFIPVRAPTPSDRRIQLQRASMLRFLNGDPEQPKPIRPRTTLLRTNLDAPAGARTFLMFEEEVPRAGVSVTMSFNRTRWYDGSVWTWLGMRKQTGRGERTSGLAFDQIVPGKKKEEQR